MITTLLFAVGLLLVLEGILPFVDPKAWRRMITRVIELNDKQLRIGGLVIMLVGLVIVFAVHHLR